jgi:hypothetical protein
MFVLVGVLMHLAIQLWSQLGKAEKTWLFTPPLVLLHQLTIRMGLEIASSGTLFFFLHFFASPVACSLHYASASTATFPGLRLSRHLRVLGFLA